MPISNVWLNSTPTAYYGTGIIEGNSKVKEEVKETKKEDEDSLVKLDREVIVLMKRKSAINQDEKEYINPRGVYQLTKAYLKLVKKNKKDIIFIKKNLKKVKEVGVLNYPDMVEFDKYGKTDEKLKVNLYLMVYEDGRTSFIPLNKIKQLTREEYSYSSQSYFSNLGQF